MGARHFVNVSNHPITGRPTCRPITCNKSRFFLDLCEIIMKRTTVTSKPNDKPTTEPAGLSMSSGAELITDRINHVYQYVNIMIM